MSNPVANNRMKIHLGSASWDKRASMYEQVLERNTVLWGRDALLLGGLTNGDATKARSPSLRLLDVACGTGKLAQIAADMGFQVTATDYSPGMIEIVKRKFLESKAKNVDARVVDGQTLEGIADSSMDVVTSNFGIFQFPDRMAAWQSAKRVLIPGGTLLATSWLATSSNLTLFKYLFANSVNKPGIEDPPSTGPQDSAFMNNTFAAATFAEELEEAGFVDVTIHTVTHAMTFENGQEYAQAFLDGTANSPMLASRDPDSVKLAGLHFCQLLADGVDPFEVPTTSADGSESLFDTSKGRRLEDHPLWSRPFVFHLTGLIAVARKSVS